MEEGHTAELTLALPLARQGDPEAFRVLYRGVQPRLLRYLKGMVGASDAEDVASETWAQIARDIGSFVGEGDAFRGWAATIARHRALDHLRRERRRPTTTVPVEAFEFLVSAEDPAAEAITAVETDGAIALIATLPRDQAEAVLLRAVMGLDASTAGRVLGKSAGAVRVAAHRGLHTLAGRLRDEQMARRHA